MHHSQRLLWRIFVLTFLSNEIRTSPSEEFSENLKTFLTSTIAGSTVHIILNSRSAPAEKSLNNIVMTYEKSKTSYVSVLITTYSVMNYKDLDSPSIVKNISAQVPSFRLLPMGYVHLYFVQNIIDFFKAVNVHFKLFRLHRADPQYILFWSLMPYNPKVTPVVWEFSMKSAPFFLMFMDFRISIGRKTESAKYDLELICIICEKFNIKAERFGKLQKSTSRSIQAAWKQMHTNHNGLTLFFANRPEIIRKSTSLVDQRELLNMFISHINATETKNPGAALGSIFYSHLIASNIKHMFFTYKLSSYHIVRNIPTGESYQMYSVTRWDNMLISSWKILFQPFSVDVWVTFLVFLFVVWFISLCMTTWKDVKSSLILTLIAPLTDHWHEANMSSYNRATLNLWSIFCFSLTILYGGEAVSSLTIQKPPEYPKGLMDVCKLSPKIFTRTGSLINGVSEPRLALEIKWFKLQTDEEKWNPHGAKCYNLIANELSRSFCKLSDLIADTRNLKAPGLCKKTHGNPNYDSLVTFIDTTSVAAETNYVFKLSPYFWSTETHQISQFQTMRPIMVTHNYLAILLEYFSQGWTSGGLSVHHGALSADQFKLVYNNQINRSEPRSEDEMGAIHLRELSTLSSLFYSIFGISIVVFFMESLDNLFIHVKKLFYSLKAAFAKWSKCSTLHLLKIIKCTGKCYLK